MPRTNDQIGDMNLDDKTESLIAIGAALAANCIPCFEHLYEKAITSGLTAEQIRRASDIAGRVKKGAHASISSSINELIGNDERVESSPCMQTTGKSCGC